MKKNVRKVKIKRGLGRPKRSNYARKKAYLLAHGGRGTDYPKPKPWK